MSASPGRLEKQAYQGNLRGYCNDCMGLTAPWKTPLTTVFRVISLTISTTRLEFQSGTVDGTLLWQEWRSAVSSALAGCIAPEANTSREGEADALAALDLIRDGRRLHLRT